MFRTELKINKSVFDITIDHKILTIGSCFANVMGDKLTMNKLKVLNNPFGTTFNPISITNLIDRAIETDLDLTYVHNQEVWYAYELHASISSTNLDSLKESTSPLFEQVKDKIIEADLLIITLGTAFVYRLKEKNLVVNNCHKIPAEQFKKELLSVNQVVESLSLLIAKVRAINPQVQFIFTVSPVRHTKDTIPLNTISKSTLLLATYEICKKFSNCDYFPAYELLMDDLRDYRFYADDLIHPSKMAEDYIWNKFMETYFNKSLIDFVKKWESIQKSIAHKPFHPNTVGYQNHLNHLLEQLLEFKNYVDVNEEIIFVKQLLKIS